MRILRALPPSASLAAATALALALGAVGCSSEGVVGSLKGAGVPADGSDAGDGTSATPSPSGPVTIAAATTGISAGGGSTCAKTSAEEARCWGENGSGSLGIGDADTASSAEPLAPAALGRVKALFAGERSHCALKNGGKLYCWGDLYVQIVGAGGGGLGEGEHMPVMNPFAVDGIVGDVARVAIGRYFMCTLTTAGEVRCFGTNDKGQLGLGTTTAESLPTTLKTLDGPATSVAASMGGVFACAATSSGAVYCWGDDTSGQIGGGGGAVTTPKKIDGLPERALEVVAGGAHACARLASGKVACWGRGDEGQLGDTKATSSRAPVLVESLTDVVALSAGRAHTCAVRSEGSVFCWGDDRDGQAGGIPEGKRPWLVVPSSFAARDVACGIAHTCAWGDGGRVKCWGSNASSQLGPRQTTL